MIAPNAVEPVVTDIDPESLALQAQLNAVLVGVPAGPDLHTPQGLAVLRANTSPQQGKITSARSDVVIGGPGGALRLHIITPPVPIRAVMLRIHGGGFAAGAPEDDDTFNDSLARACGLVIVSPEYRLVPEATMADGIADCVAAATWLYENATANFGTSRLVVAGNSAGATHAAQTVIHLRDLGEPAFKAIEGVVLDCGIYDIAGTPSALAADADTLVLPRDLIRGLADLGSAGADLETRRTPELSPLYADLGGLPAAYFLVGDLDPLSDDSRFMAARWQAAGNRTDLDVWPGGVHAFVNMNTPLGGVALAHITSWLDSLLGGGAGDAVAVVRRYLEEVVNGGRVDVLPELWAEDGVWHGGSMGDRHGLDEVLGFARAGGGAAFEGMHLTVDDLIAVDDKVVVRFTNSGTQVGPFMGAPASGKHASWLGIGVYTVAHGQITEAWFGEDVLGMLLQLGVVALPEGSR